MHKKVKTYYQVWQGQTFKVYRNLHTALEAVSNSEDSDILLRKFMDGDRWSSAEFLLRVLNQEEVMLHTNKKGRHIIKNFHLNKFNIPKM